MKGFFATAQLSADFSATPVSGCAPMVVKFSDLSTGNPTKWKWDLGNGTKSFLSNPSVTYFIPGQYSIKLIVSNSSELDSVIKEQYITVNSSPVVNFSTNLTTGCFPLPVQFTDLSAAGSGDIITWLWDFGDGQGSSGSNPHHIYKNAGNFNVSLRITNSSGCVQSKTESRFIKINTGTAADFSVKISNSCKAPASINFTNNSIGIGALSYQWNFGDGTSSTLVAPSHIYKSDGSYTVRLIVKNSTGCTDTLTRLNAVTLGNINAGFSIPDKVCEGSLVTITNTSKPLPAGILWNFGDGTTSTDSIPVKQYVTQGSYIIKMVANFGACLDSVSKPISVLAKPEINFTADKTIDCKVPFNVKFTANVIGGVSYLWDFGDGKSSADKNPIHTYLTEGNHTVKLTAVNSAGCSDTLVKPAYIQIQRPEVKILKLPAKGCAPFFFNFASSMISTEPGVSYQWDFGDGSGSSLPNPSHTFLLPGNYTIRVIVTTTNGCTDTLTVVKGVIVSTKPVANFSANPRNVCAYISVNFSDLSTGNINKWHWSFGDGSSSTEQNPIHSYQDTGYFDVRLIVMNNGCADTITFNKYIHIKPPVAKFLIAYDCAIPFKRVFTDKSIGADTWQWDFGDSTGTTIASPVHFYSTTGTYTVKLTVTNSTTGCAYTMPQTLSIVDEKANFTASDSVICKGTLINLETININPLNIASYFWNFGDGIFVTSDTGFSQHIYKDAGTYNVTLIITDILGCKDTLVKPMSIRVNGPTASFKPSKPGNCLNNAITFIDNSISDGVHDIQQWIWNYGDGITEKLAAPPFQHSYSTNGKFTVKLKVIDSYGCADTLVNPNELIISKPLADFNTNDSLSCLQKPVTFMNTSTGPNLTYLWNFGDGTTSSQIDPVHRYSSEGIYSISLSITDKYGCTDNLLKPAYVKINNPVANFLMSDSVSTCPPLVVTFTNTASNSVSSLWDFGDGTTSIVNDPSHFFATAGVFNVTLKVIGAGGCIDEKTKQIVVKGPEGKFTYTNIKGCNPLQTNFKASSKHSTSFIWDFNDGTTIITTDSILSHEYNNQGIYVPKLILTDASGCKVPIRGIDSIIVYGVKADFNASSATVCDSGIVRFIDNSNSNDRIASYSWNFGDGSISNQQNPDHYYKTTGSYFTKLIVATKSGCRDTAIVSAPVKIVNTPKIAIGGSTGACIPATFNFLGEVLAADTSTLSWMWNFDNGNTSSLQSPPVQIYPLANSYTIQLSATNSSGCTAKLNKPIQAYPTPDVKIKADSKVCIGKSINLFATGAENYTWTPAINLSCANCASPVSKPDSSIQYFVKGTSSDGCIASDSVSISVKFPFKLQVSKRDTLCAGKSTKLLASGGEKYIWSPSTGLNDPLTAQPTANPLQTTNYRVIASDMMGCFKDTGYVPIKVYPMPAVNAGEDKTINVGKVIDLIPVMSNDVTNVSWSPTSGIFRNSYPDISVKPNESAEFTVEVTNEGGCMARDKVTVYVLCNNANVFMPNTFSPNGDGANDIFYPRGSGIFRVKVLRIFNRWGETVFEKSNLYANDISTGWNGTYKSAKLLPDVFVYTMDVVCDNNTILTFKGNIALIR
ncbi:MAG: PKD domain-containing protein [Ginsengibacter sp.]